MLKKLTALLATVLIVICLCACNDTVSDDLSDGSSPEYPQEELAGVMTADEVAGLDRYVNLKKLDLSGSTCYDAIMRYIAAHPDVEVRYTVDTGTEVISGDTEELDLRGKEFSADALAELAQYLPQLRLIRIDAEKLTADEIDVLKSAFADAQFDYTVTILGKSYPNDVKTLDLSPITQAQTDETAQTLQKLDELESVELMDEDGVCNISFEEAAKLIDAAPGAAFNYVIRLYGKDISLADESIEYSDIPFGDDGLMEIRGLIPYMHRLSYIKLDRCEVSSEKMAQLRDEYPDIKVVWRVYFSRDGYNCLTDTKKIWATGTVTDGFMHDLMYCTEVEYIDLGHNCITNIDFVNNMPKLKVAVFAITWVESIEPLANCPDLEYLEIFTSNVTDLTPLASCTKLEHLNISNLDVSDLTPLYGLTNLKRLRVTMSDIPQEKQEEIQKMLPDCEMCFEWHDPTGDDWRYDENGDRVERYELLAQQFGYDDWDYSL